MSLEDRIRSLPAQARALCSDTSDGFQVQHTCDSLTLHVVTSKIIHTNVKNKIFLLPFDIQIKLAFTGGGLESQSV